MKLTLRHHFDFGVDRELVGDDLGSPRAWDVLRMQTNGDFALPPTREEWEEIADSRPDIHDRANELDCWFRDQHIERLASYGVGGAILELCLHRLTPGRELVLSDYTPMAVGRLSELFPEAEVRVHDLLRADPLEADMHLFHRIDTECSNSEWRGVFQRFGGHRVLFVASETVDFARALSALWILPRRRSATRAGWIRTRAAFETLWSETHKSTELRVGNLDAWSLEPRARPPRSSSR